VCRRNVGWLRNVIVNSVRNGDEMMMLMMMIIIIILTYSMEQSPS